VACHNPADNYATLRLADGTALAFSESMQLCAQCHGPQYRDYQRGSHGGMTGYWDLRRGPRVRNHCQHCHDPHAPQFPKVLPVAEPRDRFPPAQGNPTHD
jgi:predicted CXXCH cytochrome family protein